MLFYIFQNRATISNADNRLVAVDTSVAISFDADERVPDGTAAAFSGLLKNEWKGGEEEKESTGRHRRHQHGHRHHSNYNKSPSIFEPSFNISVMEFYLIACFYFF